MLSQIAKAARVFGCLRKPIFQNTNLSVDTKCTVYHDAVLAVNSDSHQLRWLGHLGRMASGQLPKQLLIEQKTEDETKTWHKKEVERCCNIRLANDRNNTEGWYEHTG